MIVIATSSTTHTEWVIVDNHHILEYAVTSGLNPFFRSRREISHIVRLELPESFFKRRWDMVYFYGSGCANPEKCKIVQSSLIAQFRSPVTVDSDLLAAARGLLNHSQGLACIMSMGTNTCFYDGKDIVQNVKAGGYLLGDEGSLADLGRRLVSDVIKGVAPGELIDAFFERFQCQADDVIDEVYASASPHEILSKYGNFLQERLDHPYCSDLVYKAFIDSFRRNLAQYDYEKYGVSIAGRIVVLYRDLLLKAARNFGVTINKMEESVIHGLVDYHSQD